MRAFNEIADDFDSLTASDFDWSTSAPAGLDRLFKLCDQMLAINEVDKCAPILFGVMERLDTSDLGNPGPIVHTLEEWRGGYESFLVESLRRHPTSLTVWMVNRILNAKPHNADEWLKLLQSVLSHPAASDATKQRAVDYLNYQAGQSKS